MVGALLGIPLVCAISAGVLLLGGRRLNAVAGIFATAAVGTSFVLSLTVFGEVLGGKTVSHTYFDWISAGSFKAGFSLAADPLTCVMLLVVTGVGSLIHVYSLGYMSDDLRRSTYFAYLNLFVASMLVLVLASNFLVMFAGWELVGLCSYLLISFWNERRSAAAAGKKAFIVNRIGDFGFLLALFLIFAEFGSLDFSVVLAPGDEASATAAAIALLMLLGAAGKSAQVPLYVWLPDAMEGPTPVSALIHAATMVTAGVYLVVRAHVLFEAAPIAGVVLMVGGLVTAALAAVLALAQDDIKRGLAYSTISQLGFMFVATGVGVATGSSLAYVAAIFHLVTHALFKALLFLGAGSVMHATGGEVNMKRMGGLMRALPVTGATFLIGSLAIAGIPPLAGFFSKEAILTIAWEEGYVAVWLTAALLSALTAFYMSRQVFLVFFGKTRLASDVHPHEGGSAMTSVLKTLGAAALVAGALNLTLSGGALARFLSGVFPETEHRLAADLHIPEWLLAGIVVSLSVAAIALAYELYLAQGAEERRSLVTARVAPLVRAARGGFAVDGTYNALFVAPGKRSAGLLANFVETKVVDGSLDRFARSVGELAGQLRFAQSGLLRRYVAWMFAGATVLVALLVAGLQ